MSETPTAEVDALLGDDEVVESMLAELAGLRGELDEAATALDRLYARRLDLFQQLRGRVPPVTQRRIAEASGISEVAVIQTLRAARKRAGEAAAS